MNIKSMKKHKQPDKLITSLINRCSTDAFLFYLNIMIPAPNTRSCLENGQIFLLVFQVSCIHLHAPIHIQVIQEEASWSHAEPPWFAPFNVEAESTHSLEQVHFCWCPQLLVRGEVRLVNQHLHHRCCSALPSLLQKTLNNFNFVKNGLRHLFLISSLTPDC